MELLYIISFTILIIVVSTTIYFIYKPKPINCSGVWKDNGCSKDNGKLSQTYEITTPESNGGISCGISSGQTREIDNSKCRIVNCDGSWHNIECSENNGKLKQIYEIKTREENGGIQCSNYDKQKREIDEKACINPINCIGVWKDIGCSTNDGKMSQKYEIITREENGGVSCGFSSGQTQEIPNKQCIKPVNCVGYWKDLGCVNGGVNQKYVITTQEANGGTKCSDVSDATRNVPKTECAPVNCVGDWKDLGCSLEGKMMQKYVISTSASNGGKICYESDGKTKEIINTGCSDISPDFSSEGWTKVVRFTNTDNGLKNITSDMLSKILPPAKKTTSRVRLYVWNNNTNTLEEDFDTPVDRWDSTFHTSGDWSTNFSGAVVRKSTYWQFPYIHLNDKGANVCNTLSGIGEPAIGSSQICVAPYILCGNTGSEQYKLMNSSTSLPNRTITLYKKI